MVDLARVNWNRNQPIVLYLRRCIGLCLPQITRVGGYNNRTTSRGTFSFHSEGRAADIHLDANVPDEKAIGDGLFRIFREYHDELGSTMSSGTGGSGAEKMAGHASMMAVPTATMCMSHSPDKAASVSLRCSFRYWMGSISATLATWPLSRPDEHKGARKS